MLILQNAYKSFLFLLMLTCVPLSMYSDPCKPSQDCLKTDTLAIKNEALNFSKTCQKHTKLSYYLNTEDFIESFIEIPTANVIIDSPTLSSKYLAGRAPIYDKHHKKVGTCSASFLCMQNSDGIYTDISNYLSIDNGLVVSWFTPTTLINLELDSIVNSMVTECLVVASTKIGFNPFYGKTFNMIVSSEGTKIYFKLSEL